MEVLNYFECDDRSRWIGKIEQGDWRAAKFLAALLKEDRFYAEFGEGTLYLLVEGEQLISFVTLTRRDCIDDRTLYPWLGFFYTFPEHRSHRYGGKLLDFAAREAGRGGAKRVYLATDHVGLYEKYGFTYWQDRVDVYGENSRVYFRDLDGEA